VGDPVSSLHRESRAIQVITKQENPMQQGVGLLHSTEEAG